MNTKPAFILSLAAAGLAVAGYFLLAQHASRGGEEAPLYSVYRADPYGAAALKDLLEESGTKTFILTEPALPQGAGGTLIQILPMTECGGGPERTVLTERGALDSQELARWVLSGGSLLIFCRGVSPAGKLFGAAPAGAQAPGWVMKMENSQRGGERPEKLAGKQALGEWEGSINNFSMRLSLHQPSAFQEKSGMKLTILARTGEGPVAVERKFGAGRVVMVGDPTPLLNGWLNKGGNLEFILGLLGGGPVYFDEWSHGVGHGGSLIGLIKRFGLVPFLLQIGFCLLLYYFSGRAADGAGASPERERVSGLEQIGALARLYEKAMKPALLRQRVAEELKMRAREAAGGLGRAAHSMERAPQAKRDQLNEIMSAAEKLASGGERETPNRDLIAALNMSKDMI